MPSLKNHSFFQTNWQSVLVRDLPHLSWNRLKKAAESLSSIYPAHSVPGLEHTACVPQGTAVNNGLTILCGNFGLLTCIDQVAINP